MPSSKYWRFKTIKKEEKTRHFKVILIWLFSVAAFLTIIWSFLFSPFFKITEIKLPENNIVATYDIYKFMANSAPLNLGENLFILSKNQLKASLITLFPEITDIQIKKEFFHGLIIGFEKRAQIGIWCQPQAENCYYFDKEGIAFKKAPQTEGALILKIKDFQKKEVSLGDKILSDKQLSFITNFNNEIIARNQFKISEFEIRSSENLDLKAVTDRGWFIYLDQNQDPISEADNLFTVLNEAIKNNASNLEYVDLRISSRIFYKLK